MTRLPVTLLITMALLSANVLALPSPGSCSPQPDRGAVPVRTPTTTLQLRVANDSDTRTYGLMCVLALPERTGMIFVFSGGDTDHDFWMKDTLIPLDMVWVTARGRVTTVAAHVPATTVDTPDEKIPHRNGRGTYVIELAAGEAARDGIKPGVALDLSAVGKAKN